MNLSNYRPDFAYLATPFTGTESERYSRFLGACLITRNLMESGTPTYSPIVQCQAIVQTLPRHPFFNETSGWNFFKQLDIPMILTCNQFIVGLLPGWWNSYGLTREYEIAVHIARPIFFTFDGTELSRDPCCSKHWNLFTANVTALKP